MAMATAADTGKTREAFRVRLHNAGLLELYYGGEVDGALVRRSLHDIRAAVGNRRAELGLVDVLEVSKIRGDIHPPSQEILSFFKGIGMRELVLVMRNPVVRMIVRATSFVTGMPARGFEEMNEARRYLETNGGRFDP
jgi:hypothetical protein